MTFDVFGRAELDRLIRYSYSGFLLTAILLFLIPDKVGPALQAGGSVVSPLVILAMGAAVYTLYRFVLNEMFLSPLFLHPLDAVLRRKRSLSAILKKHKVRYLLVHQAYVEIRRGFFNQEQRRAFDRNHTEATIIWITAVECAFAGAILRFLPQVSVPRWKSVLLLACGVITLISAITMDMHLLAQETRVLRTGEAHLDEFLQSRGLVETSAQARVASA